MRNFRICVALASILLLFLTACTGKEPKTDDGPSPRVSFPKPAESVDQAADKIKDAAADPSCAKLGALIHPYLKPSEPERQQEQCAGFLPLLNGFEKIGAKSYGSGGVIDYRFRDQGGGNKIQALLLALDEKKTFKLFALEGEFATPTTRSAPRSIKRFDSAAQSAIAAIRKGNCEDLYLVTHKGLAPGAEDQVEFCAQYLNSGLQKALQADPSAETIRMGANSRYAFYALSVKPDRFYTVLVALQDDDPRFVSEIRM